MSIEQTDVIDFIGTNTATGAVHLTISDHLEWSTDHMLMLQEKLETYLAFVEGGEIYSTYLDSAERAVVIDLVLKFRPNSEAISFLERVRSLIVKAGFAFLYGPATDGYSDDNG
ncbi:MAG: hypothetical protein B7Y56_15965 [Gallionellales bacterium 35-53-114]|jgi:hypothetical protein|nr:MAG: hypothetical protein B7Y56_15965 [Gallionellales bacterium 35-53-114]HQS60038.1 hypothetical protein [Gallionellaceae bacterium]